MRLPALAILAVFAAVVGASAAARGQEWGGPVRGSWVRDGTAGEGDVQLVSDKGVCDIVVAEGEASCVKQAATFLAGDIEKITGKRPEIVGAVREGRVPIQLSTASSGDGAKWNYSFQAGDWEAYQIRTYQTGVAVVGSNARGTAFAAYTLSERLGIDPLYHWTGYVPERRGELTLKGTNFSSGPPTFRFRGMFHDDEDILPRPFEIYGYPHRHGDVPNEWYAKFFETALRLRMNMVAPYTRVHRRYEVQKMASEWGLFYTSHHYDVLLSNPYGLIRYGLGKERNTGTDYSWETNREGLLRYWRGGVEENKGIDCVWPVGLRGTDDFSYRFPKEMTPDQRQAIFREVIGEQVKMTKEALGHGKPAYFHFTMYNEMLGRYLENPGAFDMPEDVTIVWPDDNDGRIRFLPADKGKWKHGVYYHLAYLGPVPKQNAHIVTPAMVAREFRKIVDAGATDYMLVNVSELREFVMEARMVAEITWDAKTALADMPAQPLPTKPLSATPSTRDAGASASATQPASNPTADRYVKWWASEYFGSAAGPLMSDAYRHYYHVLPSYAEAYAGSEQVQSLLDLLYQRVAGRPLPVIPAEYRKTLVTRATRLHGANGAVGLAGERMTRAQRQFAFDHVQLPVLMDMRPTDAAVQLIDAVNAKDEAGMWKACERAMWHLEQLESDIARAEHAPFDGWYRKSWIRRETRPLNVHRPYEQLRAFLSSQGREKLTEPEGSARGPYYPSNQNNQGAP